MIINALITSANKPNVTIVSGSANSEIMGLINIFTSPNASATQIADQKFFNSTPLKIRDAI